MAIQHRRGEHARLDPTRLLPGEWAVVLSGDPSTTDGRAAYLCFAAGVVKRMATYDDLYHEVAGIESEIMEDLDEIARVAAQEALDAAAEAARYGDRIGYLESVALDFAPLMMRVAALEECCGDVRETVSSLAQSVARLSGEWQYSLGALVAPSAEKFTASGTTGTVAGTVDDTTITLT